MADPVAVVTITEPKGREMVDREVRVRSLRDLFDVCRDPPPPNVIRVSIKGPGGEVRLNFASFIRKS